MHKFLALFLLAAALATAPANAGGILLQKSLDPTCELHITEHGVSRTIQGYATVWRADDGNVYTRNCDFLGARGTSAYSDIGMPADGFPNNASRRHATHVEFLPNGKIRLY